ncbi:DUF1178 family protein [Candidatus Pelagibacter sp.]|nr:DUF1178 family protein [Candidatus Pelagibacter sp.]
MIKYSLKCKDCNLTFESWFANSKEYEKLKRKNFLNCHSCNSINIEKNLMAPGLINKNFDKKINKNYYKNDKIKNTLNEYQKFIKDNFRNVGENFAYEARLIHYNEKNKEKGIYGTASQKDLKELKEEGIDTQIIPWVEDKKN